MNREKARNWILDNCFNKKGNRFMPNVSSYDFWQRTDESKKAYEFIPKSYESNIHNVLAFLQDIEYFSCIYCGNKLDKNKLYCNASCQNKCVEYNGQPFINAWSEETRYKREQTNLERYGGKSPYGSKEIRAKREQTNLERYGVKNVFSSPDILKKSHKTQIERYGGVGLQSQYILDKTHQTQIEKYGGVGLKSAEIFENAHKEKNRNTVLSGIEKEDLREMVIIKGINEIANSKNCAVSSVYNLIYRFGLNDELLKANESIFENNVLEYIKSQTDLEIVPRDKTQIYPYEIDIYIPELNLGFECDGCYFHSSKFKPKNYHLMKTEMCYNKGIKLIHIFEDDWAQKNEIIKNKIRHHIGVNEIVYGRKTNINTVDKKEAKEFLNKYHIQGYGNSSLYYGLYYNKELVSLMGFRKKKDKNFVLDRFCSSKTVIGGFSKLLKYFTNNNEFEVIESFHDVSYNGMTDDSVYSKFGFEKEKFINPDYKYLYKGKRCHKFNFRHIHLKKFLENYNGDLSERENCLNNKIYQIYDAGKIKYKLTNKIRNDKYENL